MVVDERGLELMADSDAIVAAYATAVRRSLEYRADTPDRMQKVLDTDPDFATGHCLKGLLLTGFQSTRMRDAIGECVMAAEAASKHVTDRGRAHIAAARREAAKYGVR